MKDCLPGELVSDKAYKGQREMNQGMKKDEQRWILMLCELFFPLGPPERKVFLGLSLPQSPVPQPLTEGCLGKRTKGVRRPSPVTARFWAKMQA